MNPPGLQSGQAIDIMKSLEEKILQDGKVFPGGVLKVGSFLNHQIDVPFMTEIGKEFYRLFKDEQITKVLTIETSGIAIAVVCAEQFHVPVVFAKKKAAANMSQDTYSARERSYTRNVEFIVQVAKEYLNEDDRVLILDDFLANGEAMNALIDICNQAKATIVGCGSVVCKTYQPGEKRIADLGYPVKVLARVRSMSDDGTIEFEE